MLGKDADIETELHLLTELFMLWAMPGGNVKKYAIIQLTANGSSLVADLPKK